MLFPPISATCILSAGETLIRVFESASSGSTDPAANTDAVLMKFLRVEVMIMLIFYNNRKGNI
jgi:hypothetical protein